jgi:nucleoside triphosphate diphosphatase
MSAVDELLIIMATLRDPERGCAWDLKQTFDTIAPYTIEEAFEVAEAIAGRDWPELKEELGDLLLQVVFHARMAEEQQLFCFADVVETLNRKLVRRHPHVFGEQGTTDVTEIKRVWEQIKRDERAGKGRAHASVLDGVPAGLPALQRAAKVQKKAATVGFDWPDAIAVLPQVQSELDELSVAVESGDREAVEDELGDLLFSAVNLARQLKMDPDMALRRATDKFSRRFRHMEQQADLAGLDSDALEALWRNAKQAGL